MKGWVLNEFKELTKKTGDVQPLTDLDSVKVRITKVLFTEEDLQVYLGEVKNVSLPRIPGIMAVGQVYETATDIQTLRKSTPIAISPTSPCRTCYHCNTSRLTECYNFKTAGINVDGFLRDYAVISRHDIHPLAKFSYDAKEVISLDYKQLTPILKDDVAVYMPYVSMGIKTIQKLKVQPGEIVVILGASAYGTILAQIVKSMHGVPIIVDSDAENLDHAQQAGVYNTIKVSSKTEKEINEMTGDRGAEKVIYNTRSFLPIDLAYSVAAPFSSIAITGYTRPEMRTSLSYQIDKQLSIFNVTNGYGCEDEAINLLSNKTINLSSYAPVPTKMSDIEKNIEKMAEKYKEKKHFENLYIDMVN